MKFILACDESGAKGYAERTAVRFNEGSEALATRA